MSKTPQDEKRKFISYFLNNYQLSIRESIWILNVIKKSNYLLDKISFVDSCKQSKIGIIMKTINESGFDISYHADGRFISKDAASIYRFFDSLSNKNNSAIFDIPEIHIQLQFPKKELDSFYQTIKTDALISHSADESLFQAVSEQEIDSFLDVIQKEALISIFKDKINESLDNKDKHTFLKIFAELEKFNLFPHDLFTDIQKKDK